MVMPGPPPVVALMMISGHRCTYFAQDFPPGIRVACAPGKIFRIAGMDVNHGRAGVIGGSDGFGDFVGGFGDDLIGFLPLDAAIASNANDQGRHPRTNSFHEVMAVGVVKRSR